MKTVAAAVVGLVLVLVAAAAAGCFHETKQNQKPTAKITVSKASALTNEDITLSGNMSKDKDGKITEYAWNFGDGTPNGTGLEIKHSWKKKGPYTVTLTVKDDQKAAGTATVQLTINNTPPKADFAPVGTAFYTGTKVVFNGNASTDSDGNISDYSWNFGDGGTTKGVEVNHTYSLAGNITVNLTVKDSDGDTNSIAKVIVVLDGMPAAKIAPVAVAFTYSAILFDGASSKDPNGNIVKYVWDFGDGKGKNEGANATASYTYKDAGVFNVTLTVTDNDGNPNTYTLGNLSVGRGFVIKAGNGITLKENYTSENGKEYGNITVDFSVYNLEIKAGDLTFNVSSYRNFGEPSLAMVSYTYNGGLPLDAKGATATATVHDVELMGTSPLNTKFKVEMYYKGVKVDEQTKG